MRLAAAVVLAGSLLAGCYGGSPPDPLAPELRARVDGFLAQHGSPTTQEDAAHRVQLLWNWANAWAMAGHTLPVDATLAVHRARQSMAQDRPLPPGVLLDVDRYLFQLALEDDDPGALGATAFTRHEPLVAASWVTLEQVYTAGSYAPREGAVFLAGEHFMADEGVLQNQDSAADNYVSISASRPGLTFERLEVPLVGMHGGLAGFLSMVKGLPPVGIPAFRLEGGALEPGDTVTIVYGDTNGGSRGLRVQTLSTERLMLPLYVDFDGSGRFLSPVWDSLRVVGLDTVISLDAFVPSVVATGEPFALDVRAADRYFNRPTGPLPALEVRLGDERVAELGAGPGALRRVPELRLASPGVYRYEVTSADGRLAARSNPVWVRDQPERRVFWGEMHAHTDFAEAQGTPEEFFRYGEEDARLDFLSLTEHDGWMDDREWQTLQELTAQSNASGRLVSFLSYEWSATREMGGHHNVFFRRPDRRRVSVQEAPTLPDLYRGLAREAPADDVLVIPHAHMAGDWTLSDPDLERLVEIYSMHGTFEWFGNLYLQNGWEIGFIGASDDHRGKPGLARASYVGTLGQRGGLAAVLAPERTSDAIFDALRGLAAYATSGQRILLDASLNGFPMGSRQPDAAERRLVAEVHGTAPIDHVEVVKNGKVALSRSYLTAPLASRVWLQVGFESSSEVFSPLRDNPRLYRFWDGTLTLSGAEAGNVEALGLDNHYTEKLTPEAGQPGRFRFHVETRGRRDSVLLELDGANGGTELVFEIAASQEQGIGEPFVRPPADLPAARVAVRLGELRAGRWEHDFQVDRHTDRVTLQLVDPGAALDRELEYVDLGSKAPGDYYYVRVTQLDGAQAWSSPFWVGRRSTE